MYSLFLATVLAVSVPAAPDLSRPAPPDQLHCRVTATEGGKRRCAVQIPRGATVRACSAADSSAMRCDKRGEGKYVAWVVARNGAKCKISKKRTDWKTRVTASLSKKTPAGAGTCDLYVALR